MSPSVRLHLHGVGLRGLAASAGRRGLAGARGLIDIDGPGEPDDPVEYGSQARLRARGTARLRHRPRPDPAAHRDSRPVRDRGSAAVVARAHDPGGRVLRPGMPNRAIQPIDAAIWPRSSSTESSTASPAPTTRPRRSVTRRWVRSWPPALTPRWVCAAASSTGLGRRASARRHGVRQWTELPLWREPAGTWTVDAARAHQQGPGADRSGRPSRDLGVARGRCAVQPPPHQPPRHRPRARGRDPRTWFAVPLLDRAANHLG